MQRAEKNSPSLAVLDLDQTTFTLKETQLREYQDAFRLAGLALLADSMTEVMNHAIEDEINSVRGRQRRVFTKKDGVYQMLGKANLAVPPDIFEPIRQNIRNSEEHARFNPLPGAVEGIHFITDFYPYHAFLTARPKTDKMLEYTRESLKRVGLSDGSNVEIVESPAEKLQRGIDMWREKQNTDRHHGHVVFIDDGIEDLYKAAIVLSDKPNYAQIFKENRVQLIAFGWYPDEDEIRGIINPQARIHVTTMPTWNLQDVTRALADISSISPREN